MITSTPFSNAVHRFLLAAFSEQGADPESIAVHLLKRLPRRPTLAKERDGLKQLLLERNVRQLVHFTRIENVPSIKRFGLIPRSHLEETAIRVALNPRFADQHRLDHSPQVNCLSFTFPNYRMLYVKRKQQGEKWAVLSIDPSVVVRLYAEYCTTNAARSSGNSSPGVSGARRLFSGVNIRKELGLRPEETTDPQAEILEDTVIDPGLVTSVFVMNDSARNWLMNRGVGSEVKPEYFTPRRDYARWQRGIAFAGEDDYPAVLRYELSQKIDLGRLKE